MARTPKRHVPRVTVIGLGRFGGSLARELVVRGSDVLGWTPTRNGCSATPTSSPTPPSPTPPTGTLEQLGIPEFRHAVVSIGTDLESSILTTSLLADFEIANIWAKATSRQHGRILERVGAHHVVLPEHDMGERVAHLVTGRMLDYIEFEEDYAMVKTLAPPAIIGSPLAESGSAANTGSPWSRSSIPARTSPTRPSTPSCVTGTSSSSPAVAPRSNSSPT